ncbi:MAG: hypothetical protein E1N59_729 [Puniceicoccaceae bacterium 5H]|nr:MAG: hypothetical protein E1N59_729 [Puniceicoccaceae bacterium 5H]
MHVDRSERRGFLGELASQWRWRMGWTLSLVFAPITGCQLMLREPQVPMPRHEYPYQAGERQSRLLVFLPGRGDRPEQFEEEGLLADLRAQNARVDVWAVDAHLNYYYQRVIGERLRADVLEPARALGYDEIYVLGISLGGLGALMYEKEYGPAWDGMILLAPYVGTEKELYRQLQAEGPENWTPPEDMTWDQFQYQLWSWLRLFRVEADQRPPVWLGVGDDDRFRPYIDVFAQLLPPERVYREPGAHRWSVWRQLWKEILPATPLVLKEEPVDTP